MNAKAISITTIIILTIAVAGFSGEYYVDSTNADPMDITCDGTIDNPWATITHALTQVEGTESDPAVIYIAEGRYDLSSGESFPLVMKSNVSLIGADRDTTIINVTGEMNSSGILCRKVDNIVIQGLTVTGGSGSESEGC